MYEILYSVVFVIFFVIWFRIFQAIKPERLFQQGKTFEIRLFYILASIALGFIMAEFIDKILSFANLNL